MHKIFPFKAYEVVLIISLIILFFGLRKEYYNMKEKQENMIKETEMIEQEKNK